MAQWLVCSESGTLAGLKTLRLLFTFRTSPTMEQGEPSHYRRLPVHFCGMVDGRTGIQWVRSILSYLDWRTGSSWRPLSHRWHPDRWYYLDGYRLVLEAWNTPELATPEIVDAIPPKKPAESVPAASAAKGGAA